MKQILENRFFPTPRLLRMPSVGIDISDQSIKFAELIPYRGSFRLGRYGEEQIPAGIVAGGKIIDSKKLSEVLASIREKHGLSFVRVAMPEEQVYLFRVKIPRMDRQSIRNAIELQLEEHIPMAAVDSVFDYDLVSEGDSWYSIKVLASSQVTIDSYLELFASSGYTPISLELEASAIMRAVIPEGDASTVMVVDFGHTRTGVSIVSDRKVLFATTLDIGGRALTEILEKNFKISFAEAEGMKKTFDLSRNAPERELFAVLLNNISVLRDEINKHYVYWHTHKEEDGVAHPAIEKIVLCGGDSNLIGLVDYLSMSMRTTVVLADAWANIATDNGYVPEINFNDSLGYVTAIGLALRDFTHD